MKKQKKAKSTLKGSKPKKKALYLYRVNYVGDFIFKLYNDTKPFSVEPEHFFEFNMHRLGFEEEGIVRDIWRNFLARLIIKNSCKK